MKILWIKSDLLHPTTKGGHIRTLELLKQLHKRHEIHYVGFENNPDGEGVRRSVEYCTRIYPIPHHVPLRASPRFALQLIQSLFSSLPVAVSRYRSRAMNKVIDDLISREQFDSVVCDFVIPAVNISAIERCIIFQHNVEYLIWKRHASTATSAVQRAYLSLQAHRMFEFERNQCQAAAHVIAVSEEDASVMRETFGLTDVSAIPTGVDVEYFTPGSDSDRPPRSGLVFVGSMDWLPNIDGMRYFCQQILPIIRKSIPDCRLAIVGRTPNAEMRQLGERDPLIEVTGTVPDVRPYLWRSAVSIVPLRIGGGTRMKIYEAMASRSPVVSTTIGAEGLQVQSPGEIRIADSPEAFAAQCVELLNQRETAEQMADAAWNLVASNFGWQRVADRFESILKARHLADVLVRS